jgi:hypothetical protein
MDITRVARRRGLKSTASRRKCMALLVSLEKSNMSLTIVSRYLQGRRRGRR